MTREVMEYDVLIVGGGAIGAEFAYFYNAFGAKVTLVEMLPFLLPQEDEDISRALQRSFDKQGIATFPGTRCENIRVGATSVQAELVTGDQRTEVEADVLLTAVGVSANLDGVFAAGLQPALDRGFLDQIPQASRPKTMGPFRRFLHRIASSQAPF